MRTLTVRPPPGESTPGHARRIRGGRAPADSEQAAERRRLTRLLKESLRIPESQIEAEARALARETAELAAECRAVGVDVPPDSERLEDPAVEEFVRMMLDFSREVRSTVEALLSEWGLRPAGARPRPFPGAAPPSLASLSPFQASGPPPPAGPAFAGTNTFSAETSDSPFLVRELVPRPCGHRHRSLRAIYRCICRNGNPGFEVRAVRDDDPFRIEDPGLSEAELRGRVRLALGYLSGVSA